MTKVGEGNTIMLILAKTTLEQLPSAERVYIKLLSPIFNVTAATGESGLPRAVERLLGSAGSEDVRMVASLLLRKNRPRLPVHAWPSLVALVLRTGDRELAAKLARQARQICPQLCRLTSAPRLVFPCPIPAEMMRQIRVEVKAALDKMPFLRRTPQFTIMVEGTAVCWEKTPFAEVLLAPGTIPCGRVAPCQCERLPPGTPRYCGHVVMRSWEALPCCATLAAVAKSSSLQCRTYPALQQITQSFGERARRYLREAGFNKDVTGEVEAALTSVVVRILGPWVNSLPPLLMQKDLIKARSRVWAAGFILVRVDRSPGRVMVVCRELWAKLQQNTFLENPRYHTGIRPSADDTNYAESLRESS